MSSDVPWEVRRLAEIADDWKQTWKPRESTAAIVDHYSIPAFDQGREPSCDRPADIKSNKRVVAKDAVLVSRLNPSTPRIWAPSLKAGRESVCSTEMLVLRPREGVDRSFLHYLCWSPHVSTALLERVSGTTGSHQRVAARDVLSLPVPVPPLSQQRAIAEVLGALDDRIEWCGATQETLRATLHARYQAEFRNGDRVKLGEVTETVPGRSYKSAELDESSPVGLVNLKNIPRHGGFNPVGVKGYTGAYRSAQMVRPGELVVACTDMTQQGDVIGRVGRVRPNPAYPTMVISMDMAVIRPVVPWLSSEYLAEVLRTREYVDHAKRYVNGTTVLHMKKVAVADYETELPEPEAVAAFTDFARPMWERHDLLDDEAHALTQLRNTLLPKLLSGELRIEDPQRLLEGVA